MASSAPRIQLHGVLQILLLPLLASACAAAVVLPTGFVHEAIVSGLDQPNSFAFLPDGRVLYTEQKSGKVRMVVGNAVVPTALATVPSLNASGYERGLQGIAVDPGWPARPYVYVYYNRASLRCRLLRYTASGILQDGASTNLTLTDPYVVFEDVPDLNPNHNGGCLRFGPDASLYLSIGEDEDLCAAQDSTLLKGAILRLDVSALPAGAGGPPALSLITPEDNPLTTSNPNAKIVWAYGMRNPFRFHVDPATGTLFACDVGEADFEEINEVGPGQNFGWPYREGNLVISRGGCPEPPGRSYRAPMISMNRSTSLTAIVGAGIYRWPQAGTANWPGSYQGLVFYSEYYSGFLRRLVRNGTAWGPAPVVPGQPNSSDWATGLVAAVDFLVGPDGSLWWLGQFNSSLSGATGSLNRIRFTGSPVDAPTGEILEASLSGAPNPFRSSADVWFRLAAPASVTLTVHDLSGRRVRGLLRGTAQAGDTRVTWDGRDDSGLPVPAGLYFVRLDRGRSVETTRLLHLK